jgi:hypothetical protein
MDIKGHTVHKVMIAAGAQIVEEYYFSLLLDRANRSLPGDGQQGGWHGDRGARRRAARGPRPHPRRPDRGHRRRQGQEIVDAANFDEDVKDQIAESSRSCGPSTATRTRPWSRSTRWSRPQTAGSSPSTARSRWMTTPGSVTPTTRRWRTRRGRPARGGGQGQGPQLRQARRLRRHHRQRRGTGHVDARLCCLRR